MSEGSRVFIVEDDFLIAMDLKEMCEGFGVEVVGAAGTPDEAQDGIMAHKPEFVLMDVRLGGKRDGVDVARFVHEKLPETKIVFVTGSNEPPTIERIHTDHPHKILIKPISAGALRAVLLE